MAVTRGLNDDEIRLCVNLESSDEKEVALPESVTELAEDEPDGLIQDFHAVGYAGNSISDDYLTSQEISQNLRRQGKTKGFKCTKRTLREGKITGQTSPPPNVSVSEYYVMELSKSLVGSRRNITMDKWFTSIPLAKHLIDKDLTVVWTIRKNKGEIPESFLEQRDREKITRLFLHMMDHSKTINFRRKFLKELGLNLIQEHLEQRLQSPNLRRDIKQSIAATLKKPILVDPPVPERHSQGRCGFCPRNKDRKSKTSLPSSTPDGHGPMGVVISKSIIPEKLRSAGFQAVQVPGGTFYITDSSPVIIQPTPILVRPAPLHLITPAPITVQPPQQPSVVPPSIVVRPAPLPPITPPPICARPPRPGRIQPKHIVVRLPKPAPIQPPPITVMQPQPAPKNPPPIFVRRPTPPTVQPPTICIPTSAIFKGEPGIEYSALILGRTLSQPIPDPDPQIPCGEYPPCKPCEPVPPCYPCDPCSPPCSDDNEAIKIGPCNLSEPSVKYLYGQAPQGSVVLKPGQIRFRAPPSIIVRPRAIRLPTPPAIWVKPPPVQPAAPAPIYVQPDPVQQPTPAPIEVRPKPVYPPRPAPIVVKPAPVQPLKPAPIKVSWFFPLNVLSKLVQT
ncbi:unnamed protein product [Parnassius apollo]|uniref:(apollo) hypothetical protein n=1 Tax=Parnassius apollo TaxID=110799 RepID=A0A8S3XJM0_PARAO|nr:unnamed protein product [Parnassius apollo]